MEIGWNVLWFIIGVSLLVTVHEFGHFWVARKLGFKVLRFSVGFGKPLYKRVGPAPDHTEFVIAALPLGGYVRMLDERDGEVRARRPAARVRAASRRGNESWSCWRVPRRTSCSPSSFSGPCSGAPGSRFTRRVVGDVMLDSPAAAAGLRSGDQFVSIGGEPIRDHGDVVLGLLDMVSDDGSADIDVRGRDGQMRHLHLSVPDPDQRRKLTEPQALFRGLGFDFWRPPSPARLGEVLEGGPAALAGLQPGDLIVAANGAHIGNYKELAEYINARPGETVTLDVRRANSDLTIRVNVAARQGSATAPSAASASKPDLSSVPALSEGADDVSHARPARSARHVGESRLGYSPSRRQSSSCACSPATSPSRICRARSPSPSTPVKPRMPVRRASSTLLVLLSLSLGFLNLLPIPILDGGQIVFQIAEWAKGRPLSDRTMMVGQQAGLLLLVLLMGVALFNDISGIAARP